MRLLGLALLLALTACAPDPEPAPEPSPDPAPTETDDTIVGIVDANSELTTLARALETSGLAGTLRDPDGAYTLFAPSNAAFEAMPAAERTALLDAPDRLASVLRGHALPTRMLSVDIIDGLAIGSLEGTELTLALEGSTARVRVGSGTLATVTTPDLDTSNGVVHVIDAVLTP